ncbi:hypothetical protein [Bradyrhizobium elkanii]|uniref:hypothetical protein n=1 Tax=Bradyrhizobium elkanii TaxID=29448 RepID=UPI00041B4D7C|nr:hypothetical protein [Bradyrhizobium elkanii]
MTDQANEQREAAKKKLAEAREARDKESERMAKAKPTPTQEENDLARLGVYVGEHEDDGSGPDPHQPGAARKPVDHQKRQVEADRSAQRSPYSTRASSPSHE